MTAEDARIAALAAECFHQQGITATGVDELSRVAGISKRTLYQRFGSNVKITYGGQELPTGPAQPGQQGQRQPGQQGQQSGQQQQPSQGQQKPQPPPAPQTQPQK